MNATLTRPAITLHIHVCDQRRGYRVTFEGPDAEDRAIAFLKDRSSTGRYAVGHQFGNHNWWEDDDDPIDEQYTRLIDFLYPLCEHQMSADNCHGPDHFMSADQERALWG